MPARSESLPRGPAGKRAAISATTTKRADVYKHADLDRDSLMLSKLARKPTPITSYFAACISWLKSHILSKPEQRWSCLT